MSALHRLVVIALGTLVSACASLPSLDGRVSSAAYTGTQDTRLGRALATTAAEHPGKSGVHALPRPVDAFAARALLAASAERSIDVQYYIWHGDTVGHLLFEALWQAAERGVRVRMLLDDLNTKGLDATIAALDAHPGIEVRLYNPLVPRSVRLLSFVTDFGRSNRRMHNKSFTVDNQVAVVGGRNIGNEYFAAGSGVAFIDLDVIVVGAAVPAVSSDFDRYWNSGSAYPAHQLVDDAAGGDELRATFARVRADAESVSYLAAVRDTPIVGELLGRRLPFEWTTVQLVSDDPAKTLDTAGTQHELLLFPALIRAIGAPETSFDLITPYFVPGDEGTEALAAVARRGVTVRILTNSLAGSDVSAVHAGYAKRRSALLRAGVKLYELKPSAKLADTERSTASSSTSSGLHAKTFAVDRQRLFVGSFNFDPRSARLNTELGLVIDSANLAQRLADAFDHDVPRLAYEVRLAADGQTLEWIERGPAGELRYTDEPGTGWWKRFKVDILSILPIEWLL